jgi:hypothetical protein
MHYDKHPADLGDSNGLSRNYEGNRDWCALLENVCDAFYWQDRMSVEKDSFSTKLQAYAWCLKFRRGVEKAKTRRGTFSKGGGL